MILPKLVCSFLWLLLYLRVTLSSVSPNQISLLLPIAKDPSSSHGYSSEHPPKHQIAGRLRENGDVQVRLFECQTGRWSRRVRTRQDAGVRESKMTSFEMNARFFLLRSYNGVFSVMVWIFLLRTCAWLESPLICVASYCLRKQFSFLKGGANDFQF